MGDPIDGVRNLHGIADIALQFGRDRVTRHFGFKANLVKDQSCPTSLRDGNEARCLVVGIGERDGIYASIIGIIGHHSDNQFAVIDVKTRHAP